ncbi:DUF2071 domain-containing protein [Uliginosibacterium gangwonense]|uniref:DUF2071 domain-containing protein n=1 Tax=Uliginosibacterium gangwonense TaxID=392736 RepID=UPI0003A66E5C|nr:DUF2071 domain-containing protein [Uliginosibacterium gangwonense]
MQAGSPVNTYRHPHRGLPAGMFNSLANALMLARVRRAAMNYLPFPVLESDVRDVVYLTWMLDAEVVSPFVPAGVRLWQHEGQTPLTILTYAHRHFGPSRLGRLRSVCPSPLQSNWRLYVEELPGGSPASRTVLFLKNIMNSTLYALGTRVFSDALPTHLASSFHHVCHGDMFSTQILGGRGSAPGLSYRGRLNEEKRLPASFARAFGSWYSAVEFLGCQDAAITQVAGSAKLAYAQIDLPIDLELVRACSIQAESFECPFLQKLGASSDSAFGFVLPQVKFRAVSEMLI